MLRVRRHRKIGKIIDDSRKQVEQDPYQDDTESVFGESNIRKDIDTRELLRSWANCHGITTRAINDLLKILILAGIIHDFCVILYNSIRNNIFILKVFIIYPKTINHS